MGKYLKLFDTTSQYNAYTADTANFIKPNVSLITETNTVEYNPYVPETMVVAKYNVTESTKTQMIMGGISTGQYSTGITTAFTSVYVDGNEIEISNANSNYTFDTVGEHTVRYELKDPTTINTYAFNKQIMGQYTGVTAISITIPSSVTNIGYAAFKDCTSLTSIDIPSGVTSIGDTAFWGCSGLTSIDIPDGVTSIGAAAFSACTRLTSCTIGSGVTTIGNSAFFNCSGLTSIDIPDSVTSIGSDAFKNCQRLTNITIEATTPPTLSNANAFNNTNNCPIYVPSGSVDAYKAATNWSSLSSRIQAIP